MCVAAPGKVLSVEGDTALVSFRGLETKVNVALVEARPGDYVLVHAGLAIERLKSGLAEEMLGIFEELEESDGNGESYGNQGSAHTEFGF